MIPCRRKWQPTPVFLPGKSHEQGSLEGYSPWGRRELDTTEQLTLPIFIYMYVYIHMYIHIYIYMKWNITHKNKWNYAICSNMDRPRDFHVSEVSQKKQISYDITYMWNLWIYDTNILIYKIEIYIKKDLWLSKGKWLGGGID